MACRFREVRKIHVAWACSSLTALRGWNASVLFWKLRSNLRFPSKRVMKLSSLYWFLCCHALFTEWIGLDERKSKNQTLIAHHHYLLIAWNIAWGSIEEWCENVKYGMLRLFLVNEQQTSLIQFKLSGKWGVCRGGTWFTWSALKNWMLQARDN